jgi:F plasmid transfer operon, TraF, protein
MKKYLPLAVACLLPSLVQAAPVMTQPGSLLTMGTGATPQTGLSVLYNPAAGETVIEEGENFRWGYLASIGLAVELGDASDFTDDVNDLIDTLDSENVTAEEGNEVINNYNDNLRQKLGEEGYFKLGLHVVAPLAPFSIRSELLGGVLSVDAMAGLTVKASILDDDIKVNPITQQFETNTAIYLKSVEYTSIGLGFSRALDHSLVTQFTDQLGGRFLVGVRGNLHSLNLSKQVVGLLNIDEDDELGDVIKDDLSDNKKSSSAVGMDLGLIWQAPNYHLGFTWRNVNEPEFEYGTLGENCTTKDSSTSMSNCFTALYFAGEDRITLDETYVMTAQTSVDAALNTENKRWRIAASYDMQPMRDPIGDEYQWASVSAAYVSSSFFGARIGLSKNQAGSELTMANAGLSLFGGMNLDVRYSLETIDADGSSTPRAFGINLGFENSF